MRIRAAAMAGTTSAALLLTAGAGVPAHADGQPVITKVVVNKGKNIVVGPTSVTKFSAQVTATDASGVIVADVQLWRGPSFDDRTGAISYDAPNCHADSATTTTCTMNFQVMADTRDMINALSNAKAGTWHIYASAFSKDRVQTTIDSWATVNVQRRSQLTTNAAPEPVKKGKTLTVTGKLSRANWDTRKYAGYSGQRVKLQYRPKNSSTYTTLKTVTTNSTGELKTTLKATADGFYRYSFPGTTTTPAVSAAGDYVDVT
ncbi:calcium-binding protein [Streptomyces sp. RP5T]|uniref:calcium-binding protein n=1 Tax=Streptomyces sp. RP5T TaxID=2490848 RepID=UPI000F645FF5|nr:calcium-binding protein [Streptomyces sp. RP5T]RRR73684.1 calcium-binding protein [Streptomyces sp. RP5T]